MNVALILSGGIGTRMGLEVPKQYIQVNNEMIITYCLKTIFAHPLIDAVQVVADSAWQDVILTELRKMNLDDINNKFLGFSEPGKNRQLSIYNGLEGIQKILSNGFLKSKESKQEAMDDAAILVHDAARPLLTSKQITDCLTALKGHDGVLPVLPMKDTVYLSKDGSTVSELLDRSQIFAGQAPEVFRLGSYMNANEQLLPDQILKINGSTEPAIMAGLDITMIPGDEGNFKITSRDDLKRFMNLEEGK